jgi:periplasmic protein TonB
VPAGRRGSDGPWRRLVWSLPAALLITALAVAAFLDVLAQAPPPPAAKQVAMWVVELPPEPPPQAPPVSETAPPPPPPKALPQPPPEKPEPPRLHRTIRPEARRPRPRRAIRREAKRPHQAEPRAPAAPPQARPTRNPPRGVTMGARALYKPIPEIPEELRHRHLSLVAVARFRVAADGSADVQLIQTTPDPRLNTALIIALKKWRFFPAMANGRPVASTIDIRIPVEVQ